VVSRCPLLVYCVTSYSNVYICALFYTFMYFPITSRVLVECKYVNCDNAFYMSNQAQALHWMSGLIQSISISFPSFIPSSVHRPWVFPSASLSLSLLLFLLGTCVGLHVLNSVTVCQTSETPLQRLPLLHLLWRLSAHHDIRLRDRQREQRLKGCLV